MHIVIDARIINSTTGRYIERLLTNLQSVDKTNEYTVLVPTKDLGYWKPTGKNFSVMAADFANYSFSEQIGLKRLLDKIKPDLVHFCMPQQPVLYSGRAVTTIHDFTLLETYMTDKNWFIYKFKQSVGYFVFKHVIKSNRQIITGANYTKNKLERFSPFAKGKVTVTNLAADVADGVSTKYPAPFKQYLLYVGQQSDYKNIKRLGDAHQKLLKKYPELGLILVGKKNASSMINEDYFTKKNYRNILFTDFVPDGQLNWLYKHATAYVFPSLMEGFGLPGLEAMGHGTPVVSSNATCLTEIYDDAAYYFDPTNVEEMVTAIDDVISNKDLGEDLVEKGYKQLKKYSWKRMAKETHAVYMKALKS